MACEWVILISCLCHVHKKSKVPWKAPQKERGTQLGGKTVRLCDFASSGTTGTYYHTLLRARFDGETSNDFTRQNPLRSFRP